MINASNLGKRPNVKPLSKENKNHIRSKAIKSMFGITLNPSERKQQIMNIYKKEKAKEYNRRALELLAPVAPPRTNIEEVYELPITSNYVDVEY